LINLIDKTMLNIDANLIKRLRNKERFVDSCEATIIIEVIIIVINRFKDVLFCRSRYA